MPLTSPVRVGAALARAVVVATLTAVALPATPVQAATPAAYSVAGVDTSHYSHGEHENERIDWNRVAKAHSFAFLKASQGPGAAGNDAWFTRDYAAVARTSLLHAPYHFFDPKSTTDGAAQARQFITVARAAGYRGGRAGELPPVLDVEKVRRIGKEACPAALRPQQVAVFLREVRRAFKVAPIVYTRASFVKECMGGDGRAFAGHRLWLARYGSGAEEPQPVPGAGRSWTFWQHTEHGRTPGIPGTGDRNVFRGSLAQLRDLAG
ncbi:glycoside hydrolase family 25 protein [Streptomyces sp. NPDC021749]|uniref:glycoside hydrolase family 25 protein n=1 Tax=Streptomyces sp. NPDC021749 TaxID=3154905 RepID=UPI0034097A8A